MSLRVLVIDDSAFARKVLRQILERTPGIEVVGTARDGLDGLEKVELLQPDVVTLDLVMPELDGLGFLRSLPPSAPPVVVVSISDSSSELGVRALQAGAVDLVHKPTALATDRLYDLRDELLAKVRAAARAHPRKVQAAERLPTPDVTGAIDLVLVGASTGGPQALTQLVQALPAAVPVPMVLALHIPRGYTKTLAERLDRTSAVRVVEAHDGLRLEPGLVAVAPGGKHSRIEPGLVVSVGLEPSTTPHRPSVDLLFESAAALQGVCTLGVVLTGMGDDGLRGSRALRRAGGRVLVEHPSTSVIYGMPQRVWDAGLAEDQVPIDRMAAAILERL